ncbi:hypothetical protein KGV52_01745, partial [Candidatus Gracilibacteria bacterium]|nr:hypothetical protein [Candidatus Gracilibacteria bacterium]
PKESLPLTGGDLEGGKKQNNKKLKTSVLSLFIAKKMFAKEIAFVPNTAFIPAPKVDSSFLYFEKHDLYENTDDKEFLDFVKKAFSSPRKKLSKNLLSAGYDKNQIQHIFQQLEIDENTRPENIDVQGYCKLVERFGGD